ILSKHQPSFLFRNSRSKLPLGRTGEAVWQDESFDHRVRDEVELERIIRDGEYHPVSAGLAANPRAWLWSSARLAGGPRGYPACPTIGANPCQMQKLQAPDPLSRERCFIYRLPALTAATTTAARTIGLRTSLVDVQRAAIQFPAVNRGNCLLGFSIVSHLHKPKSSGLSGVTIGTDVDTVYGAVSFKEGSDGSFRDPKT